MSREKTQRFSIRKLTIGAASVVIVAFFVGVSSQNVNAEVEPSSTVTVTQKDYPVKGEKQDTTYTYGSVPAKPEGNNTAKPGKVETHNVPGNEGGVKTEIKYETVPEKTTPSKEAKPGKVEEHDNPSKDTPQTVPVEKPLRPANENTKQNTRHTLTLKYVDKQNDGKTVFIQECPGKAGDKVTVTPVIPNGYVLANGFPESLTITEDDPVYYIYLKHETVPVNTFIHDRHHIIFKQQHYDANGNLTEKTIEDRVLKHDVEIYRKKDLVTGKISPDVGGKTDNELTYGDPGIEMKPGYTCELNGKALTSNYNLDVDYKSKTPDIVVYKPEDRKAVINLVDKNDHSKIIKTITVNGKTDQKGVKVPSVSLGDYKLVDGETFPTTLDFGTSDPADQTIYVEQKNDLIVKTHSEYSADVIVITPDGKKTVNEQNRVIDTENGVLTAPIKQYDEVEIPTFEGKKPVLSNINIAGVEFYEPDAEIVEHDGKTFVKLPPIFQNGNSHSTKIIAYTVTYVADKPADNGNTTPVDPKPVDPTPSTPSTDTNVEPQPEVPEVTPEDNTNNETTVAPHAQDDDATETAKPKAQNVKTAKAVKASSKKSIASVKSENENTLPQTGAKGNAFAVVMGMIASLLAIFGLSISRKKN